MLSEKEKEAIRVETRAILVRFGKTLEGVKGTTSGKLVPASLRVSEQGRVCDADFRKQMFANAPATLGDCLVAEKAKW